MEKFRRQPESRLQGQTPVQNSGLAPGVRESRGRYSRETWDSAIADLPNCIYDETTPRVLRTIAHCYIKIARAAIIHRSTLFRSCAESFVRAVSSRSSQKRNNWPAAVSRSHLIGQDTTCYKRGLWLKDGLALLSKPGLKICWIRFLYAYPKITSRLLETIAPRQDLLLYGRPAPARLSTVLKRMKRGGGSTFSFAPSKMRRIVPDVTLRSCSSSASGRTEKKLKNCAPIKGPSSFGWAPSAPSDREGAAAHSRERKYAKKSSGGAARLSRFSGRSARSGRRAHRQECDLVLEGTSEETDLLLEGRTPVHAPEIGGFRCSSATSGKYGSRVRRFYRCEISPRHDLVARVV